MIPNNAPRATSALSTSALSTSALATSALSTSALATLALLATSTGCSMTNWSHHVAPPNARATSRTQNSESIDSAIDSSREEALLLAAESRWSEGDPADSERLLNRILESRPESQEAQRMLAELHLATGRPQLALREFGLLLDRDRNSLELQYQYATALEENGRVAEANQLFQRVASSANPDSWLAATMNRSTPVSRRLPAGPNRLMPSGGSGSEVVPASYENRRR